MTASRIADRPADVVIDGLTYRWDYDATKGRAIYQIWILTENSSHSLFWQYACRWPDKSFTQIPKGQQPDDYLLAHTSKPDAL